MHRLSKPGAQFVRRHEGFYANYYLDPVGVPTIGSGLTFLSKAFRTWWNKNKSTKFGPGAHITRAENDDALAYIFEHEYGAAVNRFLNGVKRSIQQHEFDALASACFNMGPGCLQWKWAQAFKRGDVPEAARLLQTVGITGRNPKTGVRKKLRGLVRRRKEEAILLEQGLYTGVNTSGFAKVSNKPDPLADGILERGEAGKDVEKLIIDLQTLGFYSGRLDDIFGSGTEGAVLAFQQSAGLNADGKVGPLTFKEIARWKKQKITATSRSKHVSISNVVMINKGATRNKPITKNLTMKLSDAVSAVYGGGYVLKVYSGGQDRRGRGSRRTGSVRHDDYGRGGRAADCYVYDPKGKKVTGLELAKLGQYWLAKGYGAVGFAMRGSGIHLDEWTTPPSGGGMKWDYKAIRGKRWHSEAMRMLDAGLNGRLPLLARVSKIIDPEEDFIIPQPKPEIEPRETAPSFTDWLIGVFLDAVFGD